MLYNVNSILRKCSLYQYNYLTFQKVTSFWRYVWKILKNIIMDIGNINSCLSSIKPMPTPCDRNISHFSFKSLAKNWPFPGNCA